MNHQQLLRKTDPQNRFRRLFPKTSSPNRHTIEKGRCMTYYNDCMYIKFSPFLDPLSHIRQYRILVCLACLYESRPVYHLSDKLYNHSIFGKLEQELYILQFGQDWVLLDFYGFCSHAEKQQQNRSRTQGRDISIEGYKKTGSRTHLNRIWHGHLRNLILNLPHDHFIRLPLSILQT